MAFISVKLGDAKESRPVPDGRYDLRIVKAEEKTSKAKGYKMVLCTITVEDSRYPNASPIFHNIIFPKDDTPQRTAELFKLNTARFLTAFGVPFTDEGFDDEDLSGATATGITVQLEQNEETNEPNNRLVLPRLDEGQKLIKTARR